MSFATAAEKKTSEKRPSSYKDLPETTRFAGVAEAEKQDREAIQILESSPLPDAIKRQQIQLIKDAAKQRKAFSLTVSAAIDPKRCDLIHVKAPMVKSQRLSARFLRTILQHAEFIAAYLDTVDAKESGDED